jgi:probable HAF family extracellular repeat protein
VRLRHIPLAATVCLGIAVLNGGSVSGRAARAYLVEDIGTIDGSTYVDAFDINERGDIAGYYQTSSGDAHAFRYTDATGMQDLEGAAFGFFSQAFGINNAGDVVGVFVDQSFNGHGFLAPAGQGMQDLLAENRLITAAMSIQDDGRITGEFLNASFEAHPFRTLLTGEIHDLGEPGMRGVARRMNTAGQVTGELAPLTYPSSGIYSAFRFSDAGTSLLGTLGGNTSFGMDINAANVIVGCAALSDVVSHAYRARESMPLEDLGTLGGSSSCAEGINDNGEIVGYADLANGQGHAFVYTDQEGMIDLDAIIPASLGLRLVFARAINNRGQIVAVSNTLAGVRTYRLTPVERDTIAPVITAASANPAVLWPPNGQSVPVSIEAAATDNVDPAPVCRVTQVSVAEDGVPQPGAQADAQITGALTVTLRARRTGGTDRTYSIAIGCSDSSGNTSTTTTTVTVPRQGS